MHDVLFQRTELYVTVTYGTDDIRSIGWYEFRHGRRMTLQYRGNNLARKQSLLKG